MDQAETVATLLYFQKYAFRDNVRMYSYIHIRRYVRTLESCTVPKAIGRCSSKAVVNGFFRAKKRENVVYSNISR
jgi:hypothetical protein